ncbi:hypothetical protein E2562_010664 [Oryza meyeriana var. granulata]|uniref:Uncharacterized protein n=1 Tax=Oryza meyeriana var. granulata TaxID=110450 RepID=A0A6G1EVU9_9ORYZ|nr:hypothetical protein E2562_010664 [Oryza meyeriana var. granulata]
MTKTSGLVVVGAGVCGLVELQLAAAGWTKIAAVAVMCAVLAAASVTSATRCPSRSTPSWEAATIITGGDGDVGVVFCHFSDLHTKAQDFLLSE